MRRVGSAEVRPGGGGRAENDAYGRTVLVIGDDRELAVALRDHLDRTYVTVREVRDGEAESAVHDCHPWPWMVVGEGDRSAASVGRLLTGQPTLVLWRGRRPSRLAAHTRGTQTFSGLVAAAQVAITAEVCGIRLAPGGGVTMPAGGHAPSPALEVLVASHPHPLFAASHHFSGVAAILAEHGVRLRLACTDGGGAVLEPRAD